ncbi:pyrimidine 5'-nucleotidase [Futiania mangrovi]|uniref:Pyrimidine 5'-nucleotidase n=1 Tax=Futiania mangrovi TaxID=2959716 RepID=A0A9J6PJ00_9PROT|nr:pyrimidine 5'-nucleotidase [Futiania mangrovii]MCP1337763.1 pyrimidine 5'-nucleotidase [Futiania mangrovii]
MTGLPLAHVETWIFDLDNTLYPAECRLFDQVDRRMGAYICTLLDVAPDEARRIQKAYFREYGTTMNGLMLRHGIDPADFLEYVHDIDHSPVDPDPRLEAALARLPGRKLIYTNGSVRHAERVMERLGVAHHFEAIFDIVAGDYRPKPQPHGYEKLVKQHRVDPRGAAMFEDIARNLEAAHALGMTTVHVHTGDDWAREGADAPHVHHRIDDLVAFLDAAVPVRPLD